MIEMLEAWGGESVVRSTAFRYYKLSYPTEEECASGQDIKKVLTQNPDIANVSSNGGVIWVLYSFVLNKIYAQIMELDWSSKCLSLIHNYWDFFALR